MQSISYEHGKPISYEHGWQLREQFKSILPHYGRKKKWKSNWISESDAWLQNLTIYFPGRNNSMDHIYENDRRKYSLKHFELIVDNLTSRDENRYFLGRARNDSLTRVCDSENITQKIESLDDVYKKCNFKHLPLDIWIYLLSKILKLIENYPKPSHYSSSRRTCESANKKKGTILNWYVKPGCWHPAINSLIVPNAPAADKNDNRDNERKNEENILTTPAGGSWIEVELKEDVYGENGSTYILKMIKNKIIVQSFLSLYPLVTGKVLTEKNKEMIETIKLETNQYHDVDRSFKCSSSKYFECILHFPFLFYDHFDHCLNDSDRIIKASGHVVDENLGSVDFKKVAASSDVNSGDSGISTASGELLFVVKCFLLMLGELNPLLTKVSDNFEKRTTFKKWASSLSMMEETIVPILGKDASSIVLNFCYFDELSVSDFIT